jgi:signal transduction histidine kinase
MTHRAMLHVKRLAGSRFVRRGKRRGSGNEDQGHQPGSHVSCLLVGSRPGREFLFGASAAGCASSPAAVHEDDTPNSPKARCTANETSWNNKAEDSLLHRFQASLRVKALLPVLIVLMLGLGLFGGLSLELESQARHQLLIVAASGAVVISAVLLAAIAFFIQRPLFEMGKTIARLRTGDLTARVGFAGRRDEIGQLGRDFNEMVEQLRHNREELQRLYLTQMSRAEHLATLGELAAGLAHEIRNPLAGIAGVIEIIGKELPASSPNREVLEEVRREVRRIQAILSDLLDYARPKPPQVHLSDLNATTEHAVAFARQQVLSRPIEIVFLPAPGLRPVEHDPAQIHQVLLNLLLNAIQAIPAQGRIDVSLAAEDHFAVIRIADSGPGIRPEVLPNIFRPFFTTKGKGTGLGLSLAARIAEDHGGRIDVESEPGKGTAFSVRLPLRPAGAGTPAGSPARPGK